MAKNKVSEYSSTPANNTDIAGIDIAEGCAPSGINNAIRELMAQVKDMQTGSDADSFVVGGNLSVTGTATGVTPTSGDSSTKFATTAFATTAIQALYPVGSIYTSTVATNPNTLFGFGTWVAFGAGRVLIGVSGTAPYTAGATGGSADAIVVAHTHTATSVVTDTGHFHTVPYAQNDAIGGGGASPAYRGTGSSNVSTATTGITVATTNTTAGVSGTNANLPPYIVVYMWNRTA
jgi:hypothetical protein